MYFINTDNGYIVAIQKNGGGTPITEDDYNAIVEAIQNRPSTPEGYSYRLKTDLTWELYELPTSNEPEEISDSEALSIILGGEGA